MDLLGTYIDWQVCELIEGRSYAFVVANNHQRLIRMQGEVIKEDNDWVTVFGICFSYNDKPGGKSTVSGRYKASRKHILFASPLKRE